MFISEWFSKISVSAEKHLNKSPWFWIPTLYFAEGLPYFIVNTISLVMLKDLGVSNGKLAVLTSFVSLPWLFKPLWSPLVDTLKSKRWWIIATQLTIAFSVAFIALTLSGTSFSVTIFLFTLAAIASATHDISADGYYMTALDETRQSAFIGIRNTFYRIAMIFGQGVIIVFAGMIEKYTENTADAWRITFIFTAAILALLAIYHNSVLPKTEAEPNNESDKRVKLLKNFIAAFFSFFTKKGCFAAMVFMLFYRFPEALLMKMLYPFFSDPVSAGGLGLDKEAYGIICGSASVAALLAGGIFGGFHIAKHGLRKSLPLMALSLTLPCIVYPYLAFARPGSLWTIGTCIAIDQFGYGFGFTAYIAYMMRFSAGPFRTSHYAICTGFMALSAILPGAVSGYLQEICGYGGFFTLVVLSCTVTFAVTYLAAKNLES
ncbi:MFS transporter [bacterium]|nr:MFS transporter [bacterium]